MYRHLSPVQVFTIATTPPNTLFAAHVLLHHCNPSRHTLDFCVACGCFQLCTALSTRHGQRALLLCRLAAAIGLQCALALAAAQVHRTTDSQAPALCWSAAEAWATFETVLWALSQYNETADSGLHSVADGLQHMELTEGASSHQLSQV